tara:strand:+ start:582 stop:1808 length:1227 start_codon:yes stop_codon:yes gene_type:complete
MLKIISWLTNSLLLLLRKFVEIRIGLIPYRSLGRIAGNIEYYLREKALGASSKKTFDILFSGTRPVNHQILKMIHRNFRLIKGDFVWSLFTKIQSSLLSDRLDVTSWIDLSHSGFLVEWDIWQQAGPQLSFSSAEYVVGKKILMNLGVPEDQEYVCMHARDIDYTDSPDYQRDASDQFSVYDFRDCDIDTYVPAAEWLVEQGLWVIRVGHQAKRSINTNNSRIIDYAFEHRQLMEDPEFADVYLQAHCKFFLGCTAGIYYLSHIFDVPMAFVNMVPLAESGRSNHDLFILKKYWNTAEKRFMSFHEMVLRGADWNRLWHDQQKAIADEGIVIVDNTADEILLLAQEMLSRLNHSWVNLPNDSALQDLFRNIFPADHPMKKFPGYIGSEFLRRNEDMLNTKREQMETIQ